MAPFILPIRYMNIGKQGTTVKCIVRVEFFVALFVDFGLAFEWKM